MQTVLVQVLLYQFEHGLRRNFFGWKSGGGGDGAGGRHVTTNFDNKDCLTKKVVLVSCWSCLVRFKAALSKVHQIFTGNTQAMHVKINN